MSIHDYETAIRLIASHPEKSNFEGPKSEAVVVAAERTLGLQFPATYRRFLLEYGAGTFGSSEIYGVVNEDFIHSGIPDAVWYTLTERQATNLPREYIAIYDVGDGELFCLDVGGKTTEAPVIAFEPGIPTGQQPREIIAEDFGAFLLRIVQRETKK